MKRTKLQSRNGEKGFTLVELAIVMIIIGLLITGILKGQEMIANAQVSSTITQVKALDAAASTFVEIYNAFPGDMANADTRLPNCTDPCTGGDANGRLNEGIEEELGDESEAANFFIHMLRADLISGLTGSGDAVYGELFPSAPVGGGFRAGHTEQGNSPIDTLRRGHYLGLSDTTAAIAAGDGAVTPNQASRMDRKLDDGIPVTGSVQSITGNGCTAEGEGGGLESYDEASDAGVCAVFFRIQG